ncbi:hypothetical protein GS582_31995 [Rhodococcus hoagii]|nr:hypothetical protein [Prescottella equi]
MAEAHDLRPIATDDLDFLGEVWLGVGEYEWDLTLCNRPGDELAARVDFSEAGQSQDEHTGRVLSAGTVGRADGS